MVACRSEKLKAITAAKRAALATPEGTARCASCSSIKPFAEFMADKRRKNDIGCYCLDCNRAKTAVRARAYYHRHREKVRAKDNARRKTDKHREWDRNNRQRPEVKAIARVRDQIRVARLRSQGGDFSRQDWNNVLVLFANACAYCGLRDCRLTVEHLVPVSKGGKTVRGNIVPACYSCNASKQDKGLYDFVPDRHDASVIEQIAQLAA